MLKAKFSVQRDDFVVHVELEAAGGDVVAIVGPNGSGKTTAVRALAGLEFIETGSITVQGSTWSDAASGKSLEPAARSTAMVLADPLLFPHLSIRRNVAFGLRAHGQTKTDADQAALGWLGTIGLAAQAERRPSSLSTGQQQRVSLARALAVSPQLLLLDEPLSAQDSSTRALLRAELKRLLDNFDGVTVIVSHDPLDALTLADQVIVMDSGEIVQVGTPDELVRRPASKFVAQLVGLNLLRGHATGVDIDIEGGGRLQVADEQHGEVQLAFAPHSVTLSRSERTPQVLSSARNRWQAAITDLQPFYGRVRVSLTGPPDVVAEVTPGAVAELGLAIGEPVTVAVKATEIEVYPA